ncbi:MAG: hypothetical protein QOG20_3278 [Pseudonocardiales bacterium]|jgi:hypothetical protein|nr:hypothetical protein [Pseudonocardiales bacterium]
MTSIDRTTAPKRVPMGSLRKTSLVAGALYILTFITSIPATLVFLVPVLSNPNYILGAAPDTGVVWGNLLDVICALAGVGTAIALYPVVKRQNEAVALGFVTSRLLEGATIVVGVVSLLTLVTLRQDLAGATGADAASLVTTGHALVTFNNWTAVLGQGLMPGVNALLLGSLMYKSGLVPRVIPVLGLIGAPILLASVTATVFGVFGQFSSVALIAALPVALWEFSLGVWLVVKGFKPSPITTGLHATTAPPVYRDVTV